AGDLVCRDWVKWKGWNDQNCEFIDGAGDGPHLIEDGATFDVVLRCADGRNVDFDTYRLWVTRVRLSTIHYVHIQEARPSDDGEKVWVMFAHSYGCSGMAPATTRRFVGSCCPVTTNRSSPWMRRASLGTAHRCPDKPTACPDNVL